MFARLCFTCMTLPCLGIMSACTPPGNLASSAPIAAVPPQISGSAFYLDSAAGDDNAAGTTPALAWRTVAKVNATTLHPGDMVLFHSGGVWHEQLTISGSGSSTLPITISSYGAGAQPILDGADPVSGWNPLSGTTYSAAFHTTALKAFVDSLSSQTQALNRAASLTEVETTAGSVYSDGSYVYIHLADNSNPNQHTIEVSGARFYNILATDRSYLNINGLKLMRASRSGFLGNATIDNSTGPGTNAYIKLTNLTVFNWGNSVSNFGDSDGGLAGIYVYGVAFHTQRPQPGWVIDSNTCGMGDVKPVLAYHVGCIDLEATGQALIENNTIAAINAFGISAASFYSGDPCSAPTIRGNDISASQGNIRVAGCPNAVIMQNRIHDSFGYALGLGSNGDTQWPINSTGAQVLGNTINRLSTSIDGTLWNGIDCSNGASGGLADSNQISAVSGNNFTLEGGTWYPSGPEFPCSNWTLSNNTFDATNDVSTNPAASLRTGPIYIRDIAIPGLVLKNNLYLTNPSYRNGMSYGFNGPGDYSKDLTLTQFSSVAPNGGGIAQGSH